MIKDRFWFREICDDEKMHLYFNRTLNTVRDRYRQIRRMETIKFDPMVNKYFEGEYTTNGTDNSETRQLFDSLRTSQTTNWLDNTHHDEDDGYLHITKDTNETDGWDNTDKEFESEGHDSKEGNNQVQGRSQSVHNNVLYNRTDDHSENESTDINSSGEIIRNAVKQAPMNASGTNTSGTAGVADQSLLSGALSGMDFNYATAFDQHDKTTKGYSNSDGSSDGYSISNGTDNGSSNSTSNDTHIIHEGTDKNDSGESHDHRDYHNEDSHLYEDVTHKENDGEYHDRGGNQGKDIVSNTTGTTKDGSTYQVKHDRYTGRDGVLPQDALKAAMNYLQNYSTAFEWLCNKLEINFIGIYDI